MVALSNKSRVAIIGGGISGLAAAKQLAGLNPTVFEATSSIGGVWRHCSYRSTRLQTPRPDYEFSDFPWPDRTDPTFPTYQEILDYLESYATHFHLWKFIKLESKVVEIKYLRDEEQAGFSELWSGDGQALNGQPMWEVGVVTGPETVEVRCFSCP
jgi:dimethylaniline monooxygenase (N-oxide forming)